MSVATTSMSPAAAVAAPASAQCTSVRPAMAVPWPVVCTCYWPGSSSSVVRATFGGVGEPP